MGLVRIIWHPDRKALRLFGAAAVIAFVGIGTWIRYGQTFFGVALTESTAQTVSWVLWCVAAACLLLATVAPTALRPLYLGLSVAGYPVGIIVSLSLMALVYYVILTLIGLAMRLAGRDPLHLRFDSQAGSYWTRRQSGQDAKRYFRQF
jgi:hypothetical protein